MRKKVSSMKLEYKFTVQELISQGRTTLADIETIQSWLNTTREDYVPHNLQEETVAIFLVACNNDIESTKRTIVSFHRCKQDFPEIFDDRDVNRKDLQVVFDTIYLSISPTRTDSDYDIHFFKLRDTNYRNYDPLPTLAATCMLMDISLDKCPPRGFIFFVDFEGVGLMHAMKVKLTVLKKFFTFIQEGLPLQIKAIHIINGGYVAEKIISITKVFIRSDLLSMIQIHQKGVREELHKVIPKKCLPEDYGGDLPTLEELNQRTREQFEEKKTFWKLDERLRKEWRQ